MSSAVFITTLTHLAYVLLPGTGGQVPHSPRVPASPQFAARSGPIFSFDDGQRKETLEHGRVQEMTWQWETTDNLSYNDAFTPGGEDAVTPQTDDIVAVHFTASYVTSGKIIESTGDRPLTFKLGDGSEPLFQEAIGGMKTGGKRRVKLAPGSKYASPTAEETIVFELELIGIQTGIDALVFNLVRNRSSIINTAILLSFAPDILGFLGLLPGPDGAAQLNAAFDAGSFGAVDILSGAAANAAASAPVMADAANQWAVQGLKGLL